MSDAAVAAAYAQPSVEVMNAQTPAFLRDPAALSNAIDAIEQGIERRASRVWYPRWVGPAMALRGILQPLIERRLERHSAELIEAMRLSDPALGESAELDPQLGVSAQALTPRAKAPAPH